MDIERELNTQLQLIHRQRNRYAYIPIILLISGSTWFHRDQLLTTDLWWISFSVLLFALLMRFYLYEFKFQSWLEKRPWVGWFNTSIFLLISLAWIIHFYAVCLLFGAGSQEASLTLILIAGNLTGSTISLGAHRPSYLIFSTSMILFTGAIFAFDPRLEDKYIFFFLLVFYFFNLLNMLAGHRQLRRSIENEIFARKEKERLQHIIDTVPGFVGVIDRHGFCTVANKTTRDYYPGIVGSKIGAFDSTSSWEKDVFDIMQSEKTSHVFEAHSTLYGYDLWALINLQKNPDGGAIIVSIVINDLVEARKLLREQEAKAQFSAKLASLGEMAAGIAHEVNNPLAIIQGSVNIIQHVIEQDPLDKESLIELTNKLSKTTERISKIIKSLKNLSRNGDEDAMVEVNLEQTILQTLDICRQRALQNDIELKLPSFKAPIFVRGREVQLSQVLLNLLSNAIDAVKSEEEKWIKIEYNFRGSGVDLDVVDSGAGVPAAIRSKIMEPFFTTKEVNQGTGLGLSISKSIMRSHGGELVLVESAKNTTFRMHLPLA